MNFIKLASITFCITLSAFAISQEDSGTSKFFPKRGDIGASIVVNGLIENIDLNTNTNEFNQNILFAKYYLKDDLALRLGIGLSAFNSKREKSETVNDITTEIDSISKQTTFNISAGIEKHLQGSYRLDPYIFAQYDFAFIGKQKTEFEAREISSVGTKIENLESIRDGGISVALKFGGGFNYFLAPSFSIGTEVHFALQYVREGGTTSTTNTNTDVGGNITSSFSDDFDSQKRTTARVDPGANINISYFF